MDDDQIKVGKAQASLNVSGTRILKYTVEMYHKGFNEHKLISAPETDILQNKTNVQAQKWQDKWEIYETKRKNNEEKEASIEEANFRTEEAINAINKIDDLLTHTLSIDDTIDWESLKKNEKYSEKKPTKPEPETQKKNPSEPVKKPLVFSFLEKVFKSKKEKKIQDIKNANSLAISDWEKQKEDIKQLNLRLDQKNQLELEKWTKGVSEWEERKSTFLSSVLAAFVFALEIISGVISTPIT